ncbi:hypothetical protein JOB18_019690 [Solea senegalensis]|uniref:Secreted protein n=1 Tax=Solea senegalensis TaxID=28829 RepID=A0AAV6PGR8_SOLSE|nr:hypothetical protein JOB18_019690 [Solea senegalensis]
MGPGSLISTSVRVSCLSLTLNTLWLQCSRLTHSTVSVMSSRRRSSASPGEFLCSPEMSSHVGRVRQVNSLTCSSSSCRHNFKPQDFENV